MRIGKAKLVAAALAVACFCTVGASASLFTWDGTGSDDEWDTNDNWTGVCGISHCHPHETTDDAKFPINGTTWDVNLVTHCIDDMVIWDDVDFNGSGETVTVDRLRIVGGATTSTTADLQSGTILAQDSCP